MMFQSKDPSKDFQIKELEGSRIALEHENELLRKKVRWNFTFTNCYSTFLLAVVFCK